MTAWLIALVVIEAAQLGMAIWAQCHRHTHKNPSGPIR